MNNFLQNNKWKNLLVLIATLFLNSGCILSFDNGMEYEVDFESYYFSIDSKSILIQLDQNEADIFTPIEEPERDVTYSGKSVYWNQEEYLRIANVLSQQLWKIDFEEYMYSMVFSVDCLDVGKNGFSSAMFDADHTKLLGEDDNRIEYDILIKSTENYILASTTQYGPGRGPEIPFDFEEFQISAEEALQIAEESGGIEKRSEYENSCNINVYIGSAEEGWYVTYYNINNSLERYFGVMVNPYTGDYKYKMLGE